MKATKINVLHIRDSKGIHGAERVMLTLARNLNQDAFNLYFLCMRNKDGKSDSLIHVSQQLGIKVIPLEVKGRFNLRAVLKLRNILKEKRIAVIHTHDYKSDVYGLLASIKLPVRSIATAHGSTRETLLKRGYLFLDEKIIYRFFDCVIAVSNQMKDFLRNRRVPEGKIQVVQNGLDFDLLQKPINGDANQKIETLKSHDQIFAVIGRLFRDKGHSFFVEAMRDIVSDYPRVKGLIVGDGPEKAAIQKQIKSFDLEHKILVIGQVSDMMTIYQRVNFVVIPSIREGLPYTLLESIAAGIPVIASKVGDIPLLIQDEVSGYLIEAGQVTQLVQKMKNLLNNPDKTKNMALNARRIVLEKYSAEKMARETEYIYLRLTDLNLHRNGLTMRKIIGAEMDPISG